MTVRDADAQSHDIEVGQDRGRSACSHEPTTDDTGTQRHRDGKWDYWMRQYGWHNGFVLTAAFSRCCRTSPRCYGSKSTRTSVTVYRQDDDLRNLHVARLADREHDAAGD